MRTGRYVEGGRTTFVVLVHERDEGIRILLSHGSEDMRYILLGYDNQQRFGIAQHFPSSLHDRRYLAPGRYEFHAFVRREDLAE